MGLASDPWSLGTERLCQVSRGEAEPGVGYVGADVVVDGAQGGAEFGRGLGLVGGQERAQQAVVELGVKDRGLDAVGGQDVAVGVLDPADEPGQAERAQVVGRRSSGRGCRGCAVVRSSRRAGSCW